MYDGRLYSRAYHEDGKGKAHAENDAIAVALAQGRTGVGHGVEQSGPVLNKGVRDALVAASVRRAEVGESSRAIRRRVSSGDIHQGKKHQAHMHQGKMHQAQGRPCKGHPPWTKQAIVLEIRGDPSRACWLQVDADICLLVSGSLPQGFEAALKSVAIRTTPPPHICEPIKILGLRPLRETSEDGIKGVAVGNLVPSSVTKLTKFPIIEKFENELESVLV